MHHQPPFTGQFYQLPSKFELQAGAYVELNGPWDRYGEVVSSKKKRDGTRVNLIRGVRARRERTVASL